MVAFAGVLVKIIATFKEFVVAGVYGRSDAMDAFLIAFLIPNLLINLIAESMNQALIPTLVRVRELEGRESAQRLLSSTMMLSTLLLGGSTLILALSAHGFFPLLAAHFPAAKLALSERLFYALLPVVLLTGLATNCTAVLNTLDHFAWPAVAPVVTPLAIMLAAFFFGAQYGIWAIVYATVAGRPARLPDGLDDEQSRLQISLFVAWSKRGNARSSASVWPGTLEWAGSFGRFARRSIDGRMAAGG